MGSQDLQPPGSDNNSIEDCEEQLREELNEQKRNRILAINNSRKVITEVCHSLITHTLGLLFPLHSLMERPQANPLLLGSR